MSTQAEIKARAREVLRYLRTPRTARDVMARFGVTKPTAYALIRAAGAKHYALTHQATTGPAASLWIVPCRRRTV